MRRRITFLAGLAVGFVAGTRAGRERYEQMVKFSRKVVENPTVQQATRAAGAKATELSRAAGVKATELSRAAGQKASDRMPKIAATAKSGASKAKNSASKVRGQLDRRPGRHSAAEEGAHANGSRPGD